MRHAARHRLLFAALMGALVLGAALRPGTPAQGEPRVGQPPMPPAAPPTLPPSLTPIDRFRELLASSPAAREQFLATRTPAQRAYLEARLAEFDRLTPIGRELRLQSLTLRHYLLPLLRTAPTNRIERLRLIPPAYVGIVRERLAAWDKLAPDQQQKLLESESVFAGLPLMEGAGAAEQQAARTQLSPERRRQLEADLARWQALPAGERLRVSERFQTFLQLGEREQRKTLARLDAVRREKIARLVRALEELPADKRAKSLEAFRRFSALSPAEREKFLRNAARWEAMSETEQQAWRQLRAQFQPPPLPPGLPPPPRPPLTNASTNR